MNILRRLVDNLPLSPITDKDFEEVSQIEFEDHVDYQCRRMSSLFKSVYKDGRVEYHDVDRILCCSDDMAVFYHSGIADKVVEELYPITMPYYPNINKLYLCSEDFLLDPKNGDFDHKGFTKLFLPNHKTVEINRFFAERNHKMVEISKKEYYKDKSEAEKNAKKN